MCVAAALVLAASLHAQRLDNGLAAYIDSIRAIDNHAHVVAPDLEHYRGIVPCGIAEHGVTSLAKLAVAASMSDVDRGLRETFDEVFGAEATCRIV